MEVSYKITATSISSTTFSCAIKATVNGAGSLKGKHMRVRESANSGEECTSDHTKFVPKYSNETKGGNIDPKDNENNPLNENHKAEASNTAKSNTGSSKTVTKSTPGSAKITLAEVIEITPLSKPNNIEMQEEEKLEIEEVQEKQEQINCIF